MEASIRRIVVGLADLEDDPQLAPSLELAGALGATLHVVHAFRLPDPVLYPYPSVSVFAPETVAQIEDAARARLEAQVARLSPSVRVTCHAVGGPAGLVVLNLAGEVRADVIVVGATRRGALARTLLGTTAQRVVRGARVPVLLSRHPERRPLRRVLFTTDLSESSAMAYERALELVAALGKAEDAEVRALLVLGYDLAPPPPLSPGALETAAEAELERFLSWAEPGAPAARGKIRTGDPAAEIVAEAEEWDADLLVLGTEGRSGPSRLLIGSVAEGVVRNAPCDVLVIPAATLASPGAS